MAGGDIVDSACVGKLDESPQFDSLIAPDTGIRGGAVEITCQKVVDHPSAKGLLGVDHFMWNFQCLRDVSGNANLTTPTLFPFLGSRDGVVFMFPDLKCDAMDVVALADQKRCSHGAIYSTAHAEENCRSSHNVAIVLK